MPRVQLGFNHLLPKRKGCLCREEGNLQKDFEMALEKAYVTSLGEVPSSILHPGRYFIFFLQ
ncbi:hypothetical protein MtrunA17_Chr3g0079181 [Medicago truncatula]|uniref:Uncharacterized protein n=1 Tax=Medicago truncatula TaxID=3880 RepID=A0A396IIF7_MEDTR|nr:hypothetical protein MtrunA17_Chr3g0079181 [Medicago truncatula]